MLRLKRARWFGSRDLGDGKAYFVFDKEELLGRIASRPTYALWDAEQTWTDGGYVKTGLHSRREAIEWLVEKSKNDAPVEQTFE